MTALRIQNMQKVKESVQERQKQDTWINEV